MSESNSSWITKIKSFIDNNKILSGSVIGVLVVIVLVIVIILNMGHNSIVGTWKQVTGNRVE